VRLNLGCGRDVREGWVNVDLNEAEGVVPADLNRPTWYHELSGILPRDELVEHSDAFHVIEHLTNPLGFMQGLWAITKPGGTVQVNCPYGTSYDAFEDPTHVRPYFIGSFGYFSQPYYWRADYGFRGDWKVVDCVLELAEGIAAGLDPTDMEDRARLRRLVLHQWNVVVEMRVLLECVKPMREPLAHLQERVDVTYILT
jgi:hypothetical protein